MAALRASTIDSTLTALDQQLRAATGARAGGAGSAVAAAIERFRADAAALLFHLRDRGERPPIVVILGGTGTGKSTMVNRLLGADVSASSFRRTYTAGAIAIAAERHHVPHDWLGVQHGQPASIPAKGEADRLLVVTHDADLTRRATLVDTPDLDGDRPQHHAQADRAFRWAEAVVFLVTPEKYQMPELVPYYRLARRYALPALHVMNKVEQQAVVSDYQSKLGEGTAAAFNRPHVYAIPRDDSTYEPPPDARLDVLRDALASHPRAEAGARHEGLGHRAADLLDRFHDQILAPLAEDRREIDAAVAMLKAMEAPPAGVDVNPITRSLARRLQQRSILYLMGPGRMLDRVRQVPALLARLPRTAWDLVMKGKAGAGEDGDGPAVPRDVPDFNAILSEQLGVLHSRIDDVIRTSVAGERWIAEDAAGYAAATIAPDRAGAIADDELAQLRTWLETRWNATPRDTAILQKVLKHLPGGEKLTQWSEAAPYLLTIVVATHHAFFGHVDLIILGGYSLATWLTERMSNEVASRTRQANKSIADRFERMAHEQIARMIVWLDSRAPATAELEKMRRLAETLGGAE
ncbi:MAG TPA: hypothetical protein VER17_12510 [Tepidisphaeraceae bacterium]|nr:hypothetical protein [Tepidisphaeraceae bacterium]